MDQNVAMKAFVVYRGKVLILRESIGYEGSQNQEKWDVTGGRVKPGENIEKGLLREIMEETGLTPTLGRVFSVREWRPLINGTEHQIVGTFRECLSDSDNVELSKDHDNYEWIDPKDYKSYDLVEQLPHVFEDYLNG